MTAAEKFELWLRRADDFTVREDLEAMKEDTERMNEAFSGELSFGTAGLRGIMEAGTNRMNVYTVAQASQGLANYINAIAGENPSIAIGYDCRYNNVLFSRTAAEVFAGNGIKVHMYPTLMPTPCVSYAVRRLGCDAGVMVTASHNTAEYNGYKVYGPDGCQITPEAAEAIQAAIKEIDMFTDVRYMDYIDGLAYKMIRNIPGGIIDDYIARVKAQSVLTDADNVNKEIKIVYTPLNGAGLEPVRRALIESGYVNLEIVEEQQYPDGSFSTCPVPNPEDRDAFELGIDQAKESGADLILATDPDADRIGIAVRNSEGEFVLLTGNETGLLLLDFICGRRIANGTMPADPVMVKSLVSTDIAEKIADSYGVKTINVLTGFKFIGEQIAKLEEAGHPESYIFGFEESYGYLSGTYVRDKDAVNAALLICDMYAYYAAQGISLLDRLDQIYAEHGYCLNKVYAFKFEGANGIAKMASIMDTLRAGVADMGGFAVGSVLDYNDGIDGLPASNVLRFGLSDGAAVIARPSGTEPKLKFYVTVFAEDRDAALAKEESIIAYISALTA